MKTPPGKGAAFDADGTTIRVVAPPAFRIARFNRVSYGSKAAEIVVEIDGLGTLNVDLFVADGKPPFVMPASVRDRYTGDWKRTFRLDDALAAELLAAVEQRLSADGEERL